MSCLNHAYQWKTMGLSYENPPRPHTGNDKSHLSQSNRIFVVVPIVAFFYPFHFQNIYQKQRSIELFFLFMMVSFAVTTGRAKDNRSRFRCRTYLFHKDLVFLSLLFPDACGPQRFSMSDASEVVFDKTSG